MPAHAPAPPAKLVPVVTMSLAGVVFFALVTANSGGYRFGVSDQAFYLPAIQHALDSSAFPRDWALLAPQSRLLVWDELVAALVRVTGLSLEWIFLTTYGVAVAAFFAGTVLLGRTLYREPLGVWVLAAALTLRHRVAKTGVNTFEGYFHPRVLAFGLGALAVALLLRRRRRTAVAVTALAFVAHPTTALWFAMWVAAALALESSRRWPIAALAGVGTLGAIAMVTVGPLATSLTTMDDAWLRALAEKDYLFPTDWSLDTWAVNAIAPVVLWLAYRWKQATSAREPSRERLEAGGTVEDAQRREHAVVLGCLALVATFLLSLPFIGLQVALAVQLQTSRVLWHVEWLATAYLVWLLVEAPWGPRRWGSRPRALALLVLFGLAAAARGAYVLTIEHDRPLVEVGLTRSPWQRVTTWASRETALDAHFLVDPGHAFKFDSSFRVAAGRDVMIEAVKDAAMATYARDVALRVTERLDAIGDFAALDAHKARTLAERYDLDYLISEHVLDLPRVHEEAPFIVYALRDRTAADIGH